MMRIVRFFVWTALSAAAILLSPLFSVYFLFYEPARGGNGADSWFAMAGGVASSIALLVLWAVFVMAMINPVVGAAVYAGVCVAGGIIMSKN